MGRIAKKFPRALNILAHISIIIGFIGMIAIIALLGLSVYQLLVIPKMPSTPPIMPVLPWVHIPGLPTLYFTFWIIALVILASVHEFTHGVFARLYKVNIKSSGFGFLGPLPLAFVEPDEKQIVKKSKKAQLAIFSGGPFANFITAGIVLLIILFLITPAFASILPNALISVKAVQKGMPAAESGLESGMVISINGVSNFIDFPDVARELTPNDTIIIKSSDKTFILKAAANPLNENAGSLGIELEPHFASAKDRFLLGLSNFFRWLFLLNFFVGLFNLLPFAILDGGRMFYITASAVTKSKKKINLSLKIINIFIIALFISLFVIWIVRL